MNDNFEIFAIVFMSLIVILFFVILVVYGDDSYKTYCINNIQYLKFSSGDAIIACTTDGKPKYCSNQQ